MEVGNSSRKFFGCPAADGTKAANQGYALAQSDLGAMYLNGYGVSQDYKRAVEWYIKAANQGFVVAQYNLGSMYSNGKGVSQDYKKAFEWFTKAANQGLADAQYVLGNMYSNGNGVSQDIVMACAWGYISNYQDARVYCDKNLTQPQMTRTLYLMGELKKNIK